MLNAGDAPVGGRVPVVPGSGVTKVDGASTKGVTGVLVAVPVPATEVKVGVEVGPGVFVRVGVKVFVRLGVSVGDGVTLGV